MILNVLNEFLIVKIWRRITHLLVSIDGHHNLPLFGPQFVHPICTWFNSAILSSQIRLRSGGVESARVE